jgi:hypothetical protein
MQKSFTCGIVFFMVMLLFGAQAMAAGDIDNRLYADLLKKHVKNEKVNYDGFKTDEAQLDSYLAILSHTDVKSLSRNSRFAFYINAYNAFTIKLVLTKYPGINSIKEIGSFFSNPWNIKFISLQGKTISLDHIEHDILRPIFKDPRIHFAINCASKSCPRLRKEPYEGDILDDQLNDQARDFINDKRHMYITGDTLYISKIFKWFEADFSDNPLLFIKTHAFGELKERLNTPGKPLKINYLNYDWTLNR